MSLYTQSAIFNSLRKKKKLQIILLCKKLFSKYDYHELLKIYLFFTKIKTKKQLFFTYKALVDFHKIYIIYKTDVSKYFFKENLH